MNKEVRNSVADMLEGLGIDVVSHGMEKTPDRVAALYGELFKGVGVDTASIWGEFFETGHQGLVAFHRIPFYSMCEHHLVPFWGTIDVVFAPCKGRVPGFSKMGKLIEVLSRRPQLQETLTQQIGEALERDLLVEGAIVRIQAEHFCMVMRGELPIGTKVTTIASFGKLQEEGSDRIEGMALLESNK